MSLTHSVIVALLLLAVCHAACTDGSGCTCSECHDARYSHWCKADSTCWSSHTSCSFGCSDVCTDVRSCLVTPSAAVPTTHPNAREDFAICSMCASRDNYVCQMGGLSNTCNGDVGVVNNALFYCCTTDVASACNSQCSSYVESCSGTIMSCATPSPPSPTVTPSPPSPSSYPSVGAYCGTVASAHFVIQIADSSNYILFSATGSNTGCYVTGTYSVLSTGVVFTVATSTCQFTLTSLMFSGAAFSGTVVVSGSSFYTTASTTYCDSGTYFSPSNTYYCSDSQGSASLVTSSSSFSLTLSSGSDTCRMSGYYVLALDSTTFALAQSVSPSQCSSVVATLQSSFSNLMWTLSSSGVNAFTARLSSSGCARTQQPSTSSSSAGAIAGGVVGGLVAIGVAVGLIVYFRFIRKPPAAGATASYEMFVNDPPKANSQLP